MMRKIASLDLLMISFCGAYSSYNNDGTSTEIVLANYTDPSQNKFSMMTLDDPVMGGRSKSTCRQVDDSYFLWEGTVEIVDFLKEPGFCNLQSTGRHDDIFGILKDTTGIAFYITKDSNIFHPMAIQIDNALNILGPFPITYWSPVVEEEVSSDVIRLSAEWTSFKPVVYGSEIPAPALDPPGLATTNRIGMTTYLGHTAGEFSLQILAITAFVTSK